MTEQFAVYEGYILPADDRHIVATRPIGPFTVVAWLNETKSRYYWACEGGRAYHSKGFATWQELDKDVRRRFERQVQPWTVREVQSPGGTPPPSTAAASESSTR